MKASKEHFYAWKPSYSIGLTSVVVAKNVNSEEGLPSFLIHNDANIFTRLQIKYIGIYVFPGLLLTKVPLPSSCPISWPDMMAPQRTLSAFGQNSNGDRYASWNSEIANFYVTSLAAAAVEELTKFHNDNKVLPNPTEQEMLATGALPPALRVVAQWMWSIIKMNGGNARSVSDQCSDGMLQIMPTCTALKNIVSALFKKVTWVSTPADKQKLDLLAATKHIECDEVKYVLLAPTARVAQYLKVMKPGEVRLLIRTQMVNLTKLSAPWEPTPTAMKVGLYNAWSLVNKDTLPKAFALDISLKLLGGGSNGEWIRLSASGDVLEAASDECNDGEGFQHNATKKLFIFSSQGSFSQEKLAIDLLCSNHMSLVALFQKKFQVVDDESSASKKRKLESEGTNVCACRGNVAKVVLNTCHVASQTTPLVPPYCEIIDGGDVSDDNNDDPGTISGDKVELKTAIKKLKALKKQQVIEFKEKEKELDQQIHSLLAIVRKMK